MSDGDALSSQVESAGLLPAGTVLGDYQLVRSVGAGGMAVVYEARHRTLGKRVAVKVLDSGHSGTKADLAKRFVREAENVARLDHRHVVDVSHVGVANGIPYLVMEFLEGEDLGHYLERNGKLSVEAVADLLVPVVCAIGAAHEAGIVHRDLKPQNIFLCKTRNSEELVPKVVDFGISKLVDSQTMQLTGSNAILGTPFYMSPEQAMEAKNVDGRTDQFSLGVILYECVTGSRPFAGDSLFTVLTAIVHLDPNPPSSLIYPLDPRFEALVDRTLKKKPGERFASMQELGRELLKFASLRVQMGYAAELKAPLPTSTRKREGVSSKPPRKQAGGKRAVAPGRARFIGAGVALALLLGLLLWWTAGSSERTTHAPVPALPKVDVAAKPAPAKSETSDWGEPDNAAQPVVQVDDPSPAPPAPVLPTLAPPETRALPSSSGAASGASSAARAASKSDVNSGSHGSEPVSGKSGDGASREPRSRPERGANRALILQ
jgi:serine/threonine-protein kinase